MQNQNMIMICQPGKSVGQRQATQKQEILYYSNTAVRSILMPEMDSWRSFSYCMQFLNLKSQYLGGNGNFSLMACDATVTGAKIGRGHIPGTVLSWERKIAWRHISYIGTCRMSMNQF